MTEPAVTLTDYALAAECAVFCALAVRWTASDERVRRRWVVFFASIGVGTLAGGTVHGFFLAPGPGNTILWTATLLSLGVTSTAMWTIGSYLQLHEPVATWVRRAAVAALVAYAAVIVFVSSQFFVAIAMYLPATVFLLIVMILGFRRTRTRAVAYGITGLGLTFVAAAVQQLSIAIHPVYFNHNALYHVIQAVALLLIFLSARWLSTARAALGRVP